MKKINLRVGVLALALLLISLLLSSCGAASPEGGFNAEIKGAPVFKYDPETNTTDILALVSVTNGTSSDISRAVFSANFYDGGGDLIESRSCRFEVYLTAGESCDVYYRFAGDDRLELNAIDGNIKSVSISESAMKLDYPLEFQSRTSEFAKILIIAIAVLFFIPIIWLVILFIIKKKSSYLIIAGIHLFSVAVMCALYFIIV